MIHREVPTNIFQDIEHGVGLFNCEFGPTIKL